MVQASKPSWKKGIALLIACHTRCHRQFVCTSFHQLLGERLPVWLLGKKGYHNYKRKCKNLYNLLVASAALGTHKSAIAVLALQIAPYVLLLALHHNCVQSSWSKAPLRATGKKQLLLCFAFTESRTLIAWHAIVMQSKKQHVGRAKNTYFFKHLVLATGKTDCYLVQSSSNKQIVL